MLSILKNIFIGFCIILMVLLNTSSLESDRSFHFKLRRTLLKSFGLSQRWGLFAPDPRTINSYTVIVAQLENGKNINLKTYKEFLPETLFPPSSPPLGHNHLSHHLSFLSTFLFVDEYAKFGNMLIDDISRYETERWYKSNSIKIKKIHFLQVTVKTKSPGEYEPLEITTLKEVYYN
jgi:hypothetical protein